MTTSDQAADQPTAVTTEQYTTYLMGRSPEQWYPVTVGSLQFLLEEVQRASTLEAARGAADCGLQLVRALNHVLHRHRIPTTACPHPRRGGGRP